MAGAADSCSAAGLQQRCGGAPRAAVLGGSHRALQGNRPPLVFSLPACVPRVNTKAHSRPGCCPADRLGLEGPSPKHVWGFPLRCKHAHAHACARTHKHHPHTTPHAHTPPTHPPIRHPRAHTTHIHRAHIAATTATAAQIEEETRNLAHYTDFRVVSVVGGQSIEDQGFLLR